MINPEINITALKNIIDIQSIIMSTDINMKDRLVKVSFMMVNVFEYNRTNLMKRGIVNVIIIKVNVRLIWEIIVPQTIVFIKLEK